MATNAARTQKIAPADARSTQQSSARAKGSGAVENSPHKPVGYGLPCAKCGLYYAANLDACPTCHHKERVPVITPKVTVKADHAGAARLLDGVNVEQEREEFLRQFKSQLVEAHSEVVSGKRPACTLDAHLGHESAAEICKACYERLQERLDMCESALNTEVKDAAQIIYDAVWADPSDANQTYQNAASALLTELRRRAGMSSPPEPSSPLND